MPSIQSPQECPNLARTLTQAERDYVLFHLGQIIKTEKPLSELIHMPESSEGVRKDFRIEEIPVLFPMSEKTELYVVEEDRVVFCHDFIKSAFFLLSSYQEWATDKRDQWGRFGYDQSIQKELGVVTKPIVNYYFKWIADGIEKQCNILGIKCERMSPLQTARIHLTHDVDLAHYFTLRKALYRCAQVVGLRPCDTSRKRLLGAAMRSLLHCVGIDRTKDTYWSFETIQDNEAFLGYKSDWFFLPNDNGPFAPDYNLMHEGDIIDVMQELASRGNGVGLHAPINCKDRNNYASLLKDIGEDAFACRQHFLAVEPWISLSEMDKAGIRVDCSMGFSTHEGFRTSYCLPYHPFDHESQTMLGLVEVPLAMMDTCVLRHRALSYDEIFLAVGEMLDEVRKFDGVFSLLWHNSTFDEVYNPGIGKFYEDLHLMFTQYQMKGFLCKELL